MMRLLPPFCLLVLAGAYPRWQARRCRPIPAVARIEGGIVDCPGCKLTGADLTNTCVKDQRSARRQFRRRQRHLDVHVVRQFPRRQLPRHRSGRANLAGAKMDGADLTGAAPHHLISGHRPDPCEGPDPDAARCRLRRRQDQGSGRLQGSYLQLVLCVSPGDSGPAVNRRGLSFGQASRLISPSLRIEPGGQCESPE